MTQLLYVIIINASWRKCVITFEARFFNYMITIKCPICGKKRNVWPSDIKVGKGKYCSKQCYYSSNKVGSRSANKTSFKKGNIPYNQGLALDNQPNWKGGIRITSDGYIFVKQPYHPYTDKNNYVPEHRLVAEKQLKRFLLPHEIIHHINKIKTDNRPENLYLFQSNSEHRRFHHSKNAILLSNII